MLHLYPVSVHALLMLTLSALHSQLLQNPSRGTWYTRAAAQTSTLQFDHDDEGLWVCLCVPVFLGAVKRRGRSVICCAQLHKTELGSAKFKNNVVLLVFGFEH